MSIRQDVIDQVAREIYPGQSWGEEWATVCERAGYKCEYCDKDMLASQNDYLSMQNDHIIPRRANGQDDIKNYALSCPTCNMRLKRGWNPADVAGEDACREELIQAARRHVSEERSRFNWNEIFSRHREIVGYPSSHQQCGCCE